MDRLKDSWSAFVPKFAAEYLKTAGHPAVTSKRLLLDVLKQNSSGKISLLDLGCGNGQLYSYFKEMGLNCDYSGVDFSDPLLEAASVAHPEARFIKDDVSTLSGISSRYDFAIYSHVIEMLGCPEASLLRVRKLAKHVAIRFFEPPEFDTDQVELRQMDVGDGKTVPYLRRMMSRDYYRLILTKMGCTRVDIYRDANSKDQVHLLQYPEPREP